MAKNKHNLDSGQQIFFELLRAGLWEQKVRLSQFDKIEYSEVLRLAEEQSVIGLVATGLYYVEDVHVPKEELLQFVGHALQLEQQNMAMNEFIARLISKLRKEDVYAILVKGQGIAQCYEKPLWRASGDVDLLLSDTNYEKAKKVLIPIAYEIECEYNSLKHIGMTMRGGFVVELHGTQHSRLSSRIDNVIDEVQNSVFYEGNARSWQNGKTIVFLPSPDDDVIFVFTHILKHYYIEGVGLRQICDWCRLLWKYQQSIDEGLLEDRIRKAGLMSEWKAFAALAVDWLGMPKGAMPFYSSDKKWSRKSLRIMEFVMESGNFGHNRQIPGSNIFIVGKIKAACFKMGDFVRHARLFPMDSVKFFIHYALNGISVTQDSMNGK